MKAVIAWVFVAGVLILTVTIYAHIIEWAAGLLRTGDYTQLGAVTGLTLIVTAFLMFKFDARFNGKRQ